MNAHSRIWFFIFVVMATGSAALEAWPSSVFAALFAVMVIADAIIEVVRERSAA